MDRVRPYVELAQNFLVDLYCVRTGSRRFRPLMTNFYVTKKCNLRCRYCYPPGDEPSLPTDGAVGLLDRIRPHNPALNITGGEPLMHPGISAILRRAHELAFRPLLLSTNGLLLERVADDLRLVDHVVISLDSAGAATNDLMCGVHGATPRVLTAIRRAAELSREYGFELSLHSVIAPETIGGMEELLAFCQEVGAQLSLSPEHGRYDPLPVLRTDPNYHALLDRLIDLKAKGRPVFCSATYLRAIRDFIPHGCYPWVSPRVEPDGRVYFPCQRMRERWVYLQDYPSLYELMQREAEAITEARCANRCFLACYLEVERYLDHPLTVIGNLPLRQLLVRGRRARTGWGRMRGDPVRA
jgi:MoaA/NifB/PqqE/SkfB family radical SAM enzyme